MEMHKDPLKAATILTYSKTAELRILLQGYGDEQHAKIKKKFGEVGFPGMASDFWDPADLHGIHAVIADQLSQNRISQVMQIAGGYAPYLFALANIYPSLKESLLAIDVDPIFAQRGNQLSGTGIEYKVADAFYLEELSLQNPVIAFCYHFLDPSYSHNNTNWRGRKKIEILVNRIIQSLPTGSFFICQPILSSSSTSILEDGKAYTVNYHCFTKLDDLVKAFENPSFVFTSVWNPLCINPRADPKLLITRGQGYYDAIVLGSEIN